MTLIAHISDLHFNRIDLEARDGLEVSLHALAPDLLIVSGDVTQRARSREFKAFQAFIERFPCPRIVVPGNHDVTLYNPFRRFLRRLARFRAYVEADPTPVWENEDVFVIGVDTTRSFTIKGGKLGQRRVSRVHDRLDQADEKKLRLLVCHHPVHAIPGRHSDWIDGVALLEKRVDIILSGHHHQSESEVKVDGGTTLLVRAGTAISTRHRGETNAFNILRVGNGVKEPFAEVEVRTWNEEARIFETKNTKKFLLRDGLWRSAE